MTPQQCISKCSENNYLYAGVQYYDFCFCGNSLPPVKSPDSECNTACKGDSKKMCGGSLQNSVYSASSGILVCKGRLYKYLQISICDKCLHVWCSKSNCRPLNSRTW